MSNEQSNPALQKLKEHQNRTLSPNEILIRMFITAGIIFITGFIITTVWAYSGGYPTLPLQGEVQLKANGEQTFVPYYQFFTRFAIKGEEVIPKESLFDRIGPLGIGTYFYSTINAPHWILEMNAPFMIFDLKNGYLRGMEFIPYIMLIAGMIFFFKFMIPNNRLTPQTVLNYSIGISLFHSLILIFVLLAANAISPTYALLYENYNFYKGQFVGVLIPGVFLIFLYALFIGALIGSLYSSMLYYFYLTMIFFGVVKPPHQTSTT